MSSVGGPWSACSLWPLSFFSSLSYRQGSTGAVGDVQETVSSVTAPASSVAHRIMQPFSDAWNWTTGLINARDQAARYKDLQQKYSLLNAQAAAAAEENKTLKAAMGFKDTSDYPVGRRDDHRA